MLIFPLRFRDDEGARQLPREKSLSFLSLAVALQPSLRRIPSLFGPSSPSPCRRGGAGAPHRGSALAAASHVDDWATPCAPSGGRVKPLPPSWVVGGLSSCPS